MRDDFYDDPCIDRDILLAANARHDAELQRMHISTDGHYRPAFNIASFLRRGPLTDRKITEYTKAGYYDEEFRAARRSHMQKKARRRGNFIETNNRLIYSPK